MPLLYTPIAREVRDELVKLARRQRRSPEQQAAVIIERYFELEPWPIDAPEHQPEPTAA